MDLTENQDFIIEWGALITRLRRTKNRDRRQNFDFFVGITSFRGSVILRREWLPEACFCMQKAEPCDASTGLMRLCQCRARQ